MALTVFHQTGTQLDRALWCFRDDPVTCLWLSLPSAAVVAAMVGVPALLWGPTWSDLNLYGWLAASGGAMLVLTFTGAPFAQYAYARVQGERPGPLVCIRRCFGRFATLLKLAFKLSWIYLLCNLLFGLPWFFFARRVGVSVQVALFEREPKVLRRCEKLLREAPSSISLLALLHVGMLAALAALCFAPLILVEILQRDGEPGPDWSVWLVVLQIAAGWAALVLVLSSFTLSLTFLYAEIRAVREGAGLWARVEHMRAALAAASQPTP